MTEEYETASRTVVWPEARELSDVVLELRSRVEALEEAENDRRFEAGKALIDKHDQQRPRVFTAEEVAPVVVPTVEDSLTGAPAGSLVASVLSAMAHAPDGFGYEQEARAAIREVAAWLRDKGTPAQGWAMLLEQEANPTSQED
jgi:hypothetical protein